MLFSVTAFMRSQKYKKISLIVRIICIGMGRAYE